MRAQVLNQEGKGVRAHHHSPVGGLELRGQSLEASTPGEVLRTIPFHLPHDFPQLRPKFLALQFPKRKRNPAQEDVFQDAYHKLLIRPKGVLLLYKAELFLPECLFLGDGLGHFPLGVCSELLHALLGEEGWRKFHINPPLLLPVPDSGGEFRPGTGFSLGRCCGCRSPPTARKKPRENDQERQGHPWNPGEGAPVNPPRPAADLGFPHPLAHLLHPPSKLTPG
ncbi:hypothetical protein SAMN04488243_1182 [Thermus arciformis]|uniref:Uncharacterized protein n=1 Tax=Thermus arciformis TaxID=482827 RepID=A0A1G7H7U2_9DEIN|nr:hypothetical protein SAMN04488243_1182 [Thermus arciformis]